MAGFYIPSADRSYFRKEIEDAKLKEITAKIRPKQSLSSGEFYESVKKERQKMKQTA
jgi:hypothetical protein